MKFHVTTSGMINAERITWIEFKILPGQVRKYLVHFNDLEDGIYLPEAEGDELRKLLLQEHAL